MAMPITISSRVVGKEENKKFFVAFSNYALNDSGFMVECEFDSKFDLPWGVKVMEIRHKGDFSLFGMMIRSFVKDGEPSTLEQRKKDAEQKFANLVSAEISNMLNGFHGISDMNKPVPLAPASFIEQMSEEVFTFGARSEDKNGAEEFEIVPLKAKLTDLYTKPLISLGFFKDLPSHILSPTDSIASPAAND